MSKVQLIKDLRVLPQKLQRNKITSKLLHKTKKLKIDIWGIPHWNRTTPYIWEYKYNNSKMDFLNYYSKAADHYWSFPSEWLYEAIDLGIIRIIK